ncbi:MAG: NRDE family protein [Bacteroidota bacterium]
MCLILFSYQNHPKYKLVIAANRDEFYQRPTEPAKFWKDEPHVLAGKDVEAGGTWMGISRSGKISMLTNYRDPQNIKISAPSRGHLVSHYLVSQKAPDEYLKEVENVGGKYNGFNLVCGTLDDMHYYGNYQAGVRQLKPGIYGLSNALLDTPWPKVKKGRDGLKDVLKKEVIEAESLFNILYDDTKANQSDLPSTGVSLEQEEMLSPMFIKSSNYGSRCSTVVLLTHANEVYFAERTYNISDFTSSTVSFQFVI